MKKLNTIIKSAKDTYTYDENGAVYNGKRKLKGDKKGRYEIQSIYNTRILFSTNILLKNIKELKNNNEVWKVIDNYPDYEISSLGRVKSKKNSMPIILKQYKDIDNYSKITLCKDGIKHQYSVHRLVAEAFLDNPHNLETVNHINHNKDDNSISNLEWMSRKDNCSDGAKYMRIKKK